MVASYNGGEKKLPVVLDEDVVEEREAGAAIAIGASVRLLFVVVCVDKPFPCGKALETTRMDF